MMFYLLVIAVIAALIVAGGFVVRGMMTGTSPAAAFFGPRPDPRIDVTEQANIDGRRRLLLIRRDDVEHLIMTGGPVDVVIETGISPRRSAVAPVAGQPISPVFERGNRGFGQKASDG